MSRPLPNLEPAEGVGLRCIKCGRSSGVQQVKERRSVLYCVRCDFFYSRSQSESFRFRIDSVS